MMLMLARDLLQRTGHWRSTFRIMDTGRSAEQRKWKLLYCICFYRGYMGVMEKNMETTWRVRGTW